MEFFKYHGTGNDFVLFPCPQGEPFLDSSQIARICRRSTGVGADGVIFACPSPAGGDGKMRIFNADGSEAEMCGNGIRCLAKHVHDYGIVRKKKMEIETLAGVKKAFLFENEGATQVKVDLGKPLVRDLRLNVRAGGRDITVAAVNVGVPHAVLFVQDLDSIDVAALGREIRHYKAFPDGTNVDFLQKVGENVFRIRTYERGVEGETYACATGISAAAVAAVLLGEADAALPIEIEARGGKIYIEVEKAGDRVEKVSMQGPVEFVFEGKIKLGEGCW